MSIRINPAHKGLLREETHTPKGERIPERKIRKELRSKSRATRRRAQFAENARKWHHRKGRRSQKRGR
jgi:hypothetical protein